MPFTALATSAWTAGGLAASAPSIARFARSLFQGKLLNRESLAEMTSFRTYPTGIDNRIDYGLGLKRLTIDGHELWGHERAITGFRAVMWYAPKEHVTLVVLWNSEPPGDPLVAEELLRIALNGRSE